MVWNRGLQSGNRDRWYKLQITMIQLNVVIQIDPSVECRTKQVERVSYTFYCFFLQVL